jgi:hypothetical protein
MSFRRPRAAALVAAAFLTAGAAPAAASTAASKSPFCSRLGHTLQASSGAQMYCFGSQANGYSRALPGVANRQGGSPFSANVNAASPSEDITPDGVRVYGQSETSVAAVGPYVLEGWNDATSFSSPCPSPMFKEEGTGFGFSANAGASFTDEGGVPNANCATRATVGDPSVEAWTSGGHAYFYITSLYPVLNPFDPKAPPQNEISLTTCQASGLGASAILRCGLPVVAAESTQCSSFFGTFFCSFLDKSYATIDPVNGRLYVGYTEFGPPGTPSFNGQIGLSACDIGTSGGGTGPAGGTAGAPVCKHGTAASKNNPMTSPYLTLAPPNANCETEGVYPGVDTSSGDLYAGFEFNWATNAFSSSCFGTPTQNVLVRVPASCLVLHTVSPCPGPAQRAAQAITSMDVAPIPGYNRFPASDFPRVAVDPSAGTVSMVWNDAGVHPLGDILLRSYTLGTLSPVQAAPVRINTSTAGLNFLPAVRNVSATGKLAVSWYARSGANTAVTEVRAAIGLSPRLTSTPGANALVTSASTDWNNVFSDISPNFGDYTDNYIAGGRLFVAWSDGRIGIPQPFEASAAMP